jgi:uncharacterized membrane protein
MPLALNTYPHDQQGRFCFDSRPNCSLTQRGRQNVFWLIAMMTLLIASVFSWLGYWLIMPFAGLEVGVLAWAFDHLGKHAGDYESLSICGDEIVIERRQGDHLERRTLNCHWARLVVVEANRGRRVELAVRSHGQATEVGTFLTDEARLELAEELQAWIKPGQ